jgi:Spy/CpxP family protein refolding chaperone
MSVRMSVRAQAVTVLALVATLGALLGILGDRLLAQPRPPATEPAPPVMGPPPMAAPSPRPGQRPPRGPRFAERLSDELNLTETQRAAIDSILAEQGARVRALNAEVQPRFQQIAEQTRTRIDQVLTDEQRAELRRIRQARIRQERLLRMGEPRPPGRRPPR